MIRKMTLLLAPTLKRICAGLLISFLLIDPLLAASKIAAKPVEPFFREVMLGDAVIYEPEITYLSPEKTAPINFTSLGASWRQELPPGTDVHLEVRLKKNGKYTEWYHLEADHDTKFGDENPEMASSIITTNLADGYQYRVSLHSSVATATPVFEDLKMTFINGGTPGERSNLLTSALVDFGPEQEVPPDDFDSDLYLQGLGTSKLVKGSALTAQAESPVIFPPQVKSTIRSPIRPRVKSVAGALKIISRAEWGADENLRLLSSASDKEATLVSLEDDYYIKYADELKESRRVETDESGNNLTWPLSYPENIRKIIIHHTASTKNLDDPAKAIRDIYVWHTLSRGWGDIGYNYIIDQQGNIYEGRYGGEMVVGAHAGRGNFGSIGIAVLGNYQDEEPPEAVVTALTALVREKAQRYNIDTEGASLFRGEAYPNVMGHRDIMSTACPGDKLFAMLPVIRKLAKAQTSTVVVGSGASSYDFGWAAVSAPIVSMTPSSKKMASLKVKNTGTQPWTADSHFRVKSTENAKIFLNNSSNILTGTVGREVKPGETAEIKVLLSSKAVSGSALLELQPIINGHQNMDRSLSFGLQVSTPPPKLKYDYELTSIIYGKTEFKKGDLVTVTVKLRNKGTAPWQKTGNNRLTLGADAPRDHVNNLLSKPSNRLADLQEELVKSGELGTFVFNIRIPEKDGTYKEYFTPVVEGIQWMQNRNSYLLVQVGSLTSADDTMVDGVPETIPNISQPSSGNVPASSAAPSSPPANSVSNPTPTGSGIVNIAPSKLVTTSRPRDIRIDLAYRGNPAVISADGPFALYEGKRKLADLSANEQVNVKYENGSFTVTAKLQNYNVAGRPRLVPSSGTIMRVDNWERRNTWGDRANNNEFRGTLEVLLYDGELHIVNELPLEDYLKGIAEESSTAPDEKIKTIMVIARTYARFYMDVSKKFPGAPFDLNDDPNYSQKYLGYSFEKRSPKTARLAAETAGKYVTYQGKLIKTPYFSRSDGKRTISAAQKWGWSDTPFLVSVDDSHCKSTEFAGHGVGLSGCGATALAQQGKTFKEIITYYYQGTEITQALY